MPFLAEHAAAHQIDSERAEVSPPGPSDELSENRVR